MAESTAVEPDVHVPGFEIRSIIASGGMGQVRYARDTVFDREVAVKLLLPECRRHPEIVARFATEARITGRLQHPGIPPVHHIGQMPDGSPFLAMKLIQGRTLADLLAEKARERSEFVRIFEQICQAVGYAHQRGVIHRDLKPQNVMVGEFGEVQVMDWGLAKEMRSAELQLRSAECGVRNEVQHSSPTPAALQSDFPTPHSEPICTPLSEPPIERTAVPTPAAETTQPGQVFGTLPYMPPEQARGQTDRIDARSDVFSLGAILCALLTGKPPYHGVGKAAMEVLAQNCDTADAFRRFDECGADPELLAIGKHCLAKERDERPADGGEVAKLVAEYRAGVEQRLRDAEAEQAATAARLAGERKRRRLRQLSAALAGLIVLGGVGFVLWSSDQAQKRRLVAERHDAERKQSDAEAHAKELELAAQRRETEAQTALQSLKTARARDGVRASVQQAYALLKHYRYDEALAAATAAKPLFAGGGLDDLVPHWNQVLDDIAFARILDEIRYRKWIPRSAARPTPIAGRDQIAIPFDKTTAAANYTAAFARRGWNLDAGDPAAVAERIQRSEIRQELIDALDDWALYEPDASRRDRLLAILRAADPGEWTERFRTPSIRDSKAALSRLADSADPARIPSGTLAALAEALNGHSLDPSPLLLRAQLATPSDFQVLFVLGMWYDRFGDLDRAIAFYRAARSARPDSAVVHNNLAGVLRRRYLDAADPKPAADLTEARALLRRAVELDPSAAAPRASLSIDWAAQKNWPSAIAEIREAIRIDPTYDQYHQILGQYLMEANDWPGALAALQEAKRLDPRNLQTRRMVMMVHQHNKDYPNAVAECRGMVEIAPNDPDTHFLLGIMLFNSGRHAEAIPPLQRAQELGRKHFGSEYKFAGTIKTVIAECRNSVRIEADIPDLLSGDLVPDDPADYLAAARLCWRSLNRYTDAVRLFRKGFAADPSLAQSVSESNRYYAAEAAVQAGFGRGLNPASPNERTKYRRTALKWLQNELAFRTELAQKRSNHEGVHQTVSNWLANTELVRVRNPFFLASLPPDEAEEWLDFWTAVRELRDRTAPQ